MSPTLKVGLTGGMATGKSTVAQALREAGSTVIDADRLVADLYLPGKDGTGAVQGLFGDKMLTPEGGVDHSRLAREVFSNTQSRVHLERAIHPLVRRDFAALIEEERGIVVLEATLLVEAGMAGEFDFVVSVEANPESQLQRAVARGLSEEAARARLQAQMSSGALRRSGADLLIWNDGSREELQSKIENLILKLSAMTAAKPTTSH